ncbi:MAG TPA: peptidoglycan DD-metalloendopeptidase family protein [Candidatus Acidoferrales bacterium]|nr:peptidoglycan DD-metalloendopeptidase family protein [Candidatus Acidoferrales bacterium]
MSISSGQEKPKLNTKKQELQQLRGNIKLYQKEIEESTKKESSSLETLDRLEKQNLQAHQTIKRISDQISANSRNVGNIENQIQFAGNKLSYLSNEYAHFARSFYERGTMHDLELILTASSVNEMLIRYEYLRRFSEQTKADMASISSERDKLSQLREQLHQQLNRQENFLAQKNTEEGKLSSRIKEQKDLITVLRKNKEVYAEQLKRSQDAAAELEKLIQTLIAEEEEKKKQEARLAAKKINESNPPATSEPVNESERSEIKGRLPWPVSNGRIVAKFGEHENPVLKTVTLNYGIDIAVKENSEVKSVADGEVSRIFWLPSYGNLVIIDNYKGLRTVYSHLADIFVKEGDKVKAGEAIGTVGESLSGSVLHFEVWLEKDKQDPETWLSKK